MKVVINSCYGGFGLSHEAIMLWCDLKGITVYPIEEKWSLTIYSKVPPEERAKDLDNDEFYSMSLEERKDHNRRYTEQTLDVYDEIARNDPVLIQVVEELGAAANGSHAKLKIIEIPDGIQWDIEEYDGVETICERHRKWS